MRLRLRARPIHTMVGASCCVWMFTTPLIIGLLLLMFSAGTIRGGFRARCAGRSGSDGKRCLQIVRLQIVTFRWYGTVSRSSHF